MAPVRKQGLQAGTCGCQFANSRLTGTAAGVMAPAAVLASRATCGRGEPGWLVDCMASGSSLMPTTIGPHEQQTRPGRNRGVAPSSLSAAGANPAFCSAEGVATAKSVDARTDGLTRHDPGLNREAAPFSVGTEPSVGLLARSASREANRCGSRSRTRSFLALAAVLAFTACGYGEKKRVEPFLTTHRYITNCCKESRGIADVEKMVIHITDETTNKIVQAEGYICLPFQGCKMEVR